MEALNIVDLIEHNPITKLSQSYNGKLLTKIQEGFSNFEQQLFVSSFYCYLNYNSKTDFVVDLDNIWKWLGFSVKIKAKTLLEKYFTVNIDYKNLLCDSAKQDSEEETKHGGHNKETIMLTVKTFKLFCLKAGTKKADEIHEYYLKMEEIIQDTINEESNELKMQLSAKDTQIQNIKQTSEQEKQDLILLQFPKNTECVYIGSIENTNSNNEKLIKFGQSNNLSIRVQAHKKDFTNFKLIGAFKVQNKVEIENDIKQHSKIKKQIRSLTIVNENYTELISIDETCTISKINTYIKSIIELKVCNIDNFNLLVKENEELKTANYALDDSFKEHKKMNDQHILKINELEEIIKKQKERIDFLMEEESDEKKEKEMNPLLPQTELTKKFDTFIGEECIVRLDVEVSSTDIEAQFRIWMKTKPTKEIYHEFKSYLNIRFKPKRLNDQNKNQIVHGFQGIMLKPIDYKKRFVDSNPENFIFNVCKFAPNNRILNVVLLNEYKRWKQPLNKSSISDKEDMKELTFYLEQCPYVQKGALWIGSDSEAKKVLESVDSKSNFGYYGISLKTDNQYVHKASSSTGKKVNKIETSTGSVLNTWDTIAKAASYEQISPAKMSRSISNNTKFAENYHYAIAV
jgi:hypothetical protein